MNVSLDDIACNLELREHGIWMAKTRAPVSYPNDGNESCFLVEDSSFWFQHRNHCILEVVRVFPPQGAIFDIGGGNGFVAQALCRAGWNTVVVEPGIHGARNARKRGLSHVVCSTLEDAQFRPASLPAVGMFDVLEHVDDDVRVLAQLRKLMVPGGRLYATVPAHHWLWSREDDSAGHFRRYSKRGLSRRLRQAGFAVEFSTYIFVLLPPGIFIFRTLPSAFGFHPADRVSKGTREHLMPQGLLSRLFKWSLVAEVHALRNHRALLFGASCLVVARAPGP